MTNLPVTIIIPTYNRASHVQAVLSQLQDQSFCNYEVLLVDQSDPSDAESNAQYVKSSCDRRVCYLHLSQRGPSNARNEGLARARGEIVLFLDDDVILLTRDFIRAHLRAYVDPSVGGVVGRHIERIVRANSSRTACHVSWSGRTIYNLFGTKRIQVGSVKSSNASFRTAAIRQIGGFDRRISFLEESDLATRVRAAGWRLMFEPEAELLHLSAPVGGTRENDELQSELCRFESTAYYILKHRGLLGVPSFVVTFTLIAVVRALRFRSLIAFLALCGAILHGFSEARKGPDQSLPELGRSEAPGANRWSTAR